MPNVPYNPAQTDYELWVNLLTDLGVVNISTTSPLPTELKSILQYLNQGLQYGPAVLGAASFQPLLSLASTIDRRLVNATNFAAGSTNVYMYAVWLPAGTKVSNFNTVMGVGDAGPTHNWYGLADLNRNLLAVSADNTSNTTTGVKTYAVATTAAGTATSFTTTYAGLYYIVASFTTTNSPAWYQNNGTLAVIQGITPVLGGISATSGAGVPTFPTQFGAITSNAGLPYFYLT